MQRRVPNEPADHETIQWITKRYSQNINRVFDLVQYAESSRADERSTELDEASITDDIVRAAIVFAHSALEDFIRSIGRHRYRRLKGDLLSELPLPDSREKKMTLAALAQYEGNSVSEVLEAAIEAYFSRRSFSSTTETVAFLNSIAIRPTFAKAALPYIDELMKRRHQVVHQADFEHHDDQQVPHLSGAEKRRVLLWTRACDCLVFSILVELAPEARRAEAESVAQKSADDVAKRAAELDG